MTHIALGIFAPDAPLAVALRRGLFFDRGLHVELHRVTSSREQFQDLASGRFDIVQTAFDNVANYARNAGNALGSRLDVVAVAPMDHGMGLTLTLRPGLSDPAQVRTVSVDAPTSGFAYVIYALLGRFGLVAGTDYQVLSHGGVLQRSQRLLSGDADATLLSNGLETAAQAQGAALRGGVLDLAPAYQGSVLATRRPTASAHSADIHLFTEAYASARTLVFDADVRPQVIADIAAIREVDTEFAGRILDAELAPAGLVRETTFDSAALRGTLELRARFGGFDDAEDLETLTGPTSELVWTP